MQLCSVKDSLFSNYIIHSIHRPYGCFYFFEYYVVSEIYEGVVFTGLQGLDIFTHITEFYDGIKRSKHFILISNRVNRYCVKPVDWLDFQFLDRFMVGYAIVDNTPRAHYAASFEQQFLNCESQVFPELMSAMRWSTQLHTKFDLN